METANLRTGRTTPRSAAQAAAQAEAFRRLQLETERQLQEQRLTFQRALARR